MSTQTSHSLFNFPRRVIEYLEALKFASPLLAARLLLADIFYSSGRTKVGGEYLVPSDFAITLFEEEYALPILDPTIAAHMALYAETFLPIMLVLGLGARFAATGLLAMTLVIQIFVYPGDWMHHLPWAVGLVAILLQGPGKISIDHYARKKFL